MIMYSGRWDGGTGRISDPNHYQEHDPPKDGGFAFLSGGSIFSLGGESHGVRVNLTASTLNLIYSDVDHINVNNLQYSYISPGFATLAVTGGSAVRSGISLGAAGAAPDTLHVRIADTSSVDVGGVTSVVNKSVLDESGAANAIYYNTGTINTSGGSSIKLMTDVGGTGTIADIPAVNGATTGFGSSIELGGAVASTQTIRLDAGTLQIDQPMQFQATIEEMNPGHTPDHARPTNANAGTIVLANTHIDGAKLLGGTELVLTNAGVTVADLHFAPLGGGPAGLYLSNSGGNAVIAGYWVPGSDIIHLPTMPATT